MLSFETLNRTFINYYYFVKTKLVFIYIHFNMFPFLWCDQLISCCEYRQYSKYLGYLVFSSNRMSCIVPTKLEVLERKKFVLAIHLICKLPTLHFEIDSGNFKFFPRTTLSKNCPHQLLFTFLHSISLKKNFSEKLVRQKSHQSQRFRRPCQRSWFC